MSGYREFNSSLIEFLDSSAISGELPREKAAHLLNGSARSAVSEFVPYQVRKKNGIFFTPPRFCNLMYHLVPKRSPSRVYHDPSCGAGDLLLSVARGFPVENRLSSTLKNWSRFLTGTELEPDFIDTTKLRLALLAATKGARIDVDSSQILSCFGSIAQGDFLSANHPIEADIVLANPPFTLAEADASYKFGHGRVSRAAVFVDKILDRVNAGTKLIALLPDVLRSGTNYARWRASVSSRSDIRQIRPLGVFDSEADIDVFLLSTVKRMESNEREWAWTGAQSASKKLSDYFEIHVGSVVPHRDPQSGPIVPFFTAKDLPPWKVIRAALKTRRYSGTLSKAPALIVRRTSRVEDTHRATATVLAMASEVALENHLIVLLPTGGGVERCKAGMRFLQSSYVDRWLNQRIRCRHLTIDALRQLPVPRNRL